MTALSIQPPFPIITDIDGQPLEDGYIWIGTAGLNPIGNPISVYWDAALSVPAALPVRTRGGYPMRSGTPARLYVDSDYSLLVQNKNGSTVYSALTATERLSGVVVEVDATDVAFLQAGTGAVTRTAQAKMRDTVSVKDFGAVGDGVADDTAAIQAALNAHTAIDFGNQGLVYKITAALIVRSGSYLTAKGATIRQYTNVTSFFNIVGKTDITINGISFFDTGAGYVTNDANPHAPVFGGTGTSRVSVTNCTFTNVVYAAVRFAASTEVLVSGNVIVGPGSSVIPPVSNIRCYGVVFDVGCENYRCNENDISDTTHGIRVEKSIKGVCSGNVIHDIPGQHGFYFGAAVQDTVISGNKISNIALQGIKVQAENGYSDVVNLTIVGNTINNCDDQGIAIQNGAGSSPQTAKCNNATISGNSVKDVGGAGIYIANAKNCQVTGNSVWIAAQYGIVFSASDFLSIVGNQFVDIGKSGARDLSGCTNVIIQSNSFRNCATSNTGSDKYGILINSGSEYVIDGNTISDANAKMQYGIFITSNINSTLSLTNNICLNSTDAALRLASTSAMREYFGNYWNGTLDATFSDPGRPAIASAADLVLPQQQNFVWITGTTNITSISPKGHGNRIVTLGFEDALTVTDGSNLLLAGNFTTTFGDTLTLACDGANWFEVARAVT